MNLLQQAGTAIYGQENWRIIIDDLHLNERTVRRFMNGQAEIPPTLRREIEALLLDRYNRMTEIAKMLTAMSGATVEWPTGLKPFTHSMICKKCGHPLMRDTDMGFVSILGGGDKAGNYHHGCAPPDK